MEIRGTSPATSAKNLWKMSGESVAELALNVAFADDRGVEPGGDLEQVADRVVAAEMPEGVGEAAARERRREAAAELFGRRRGEVAHHRGDLRTGGRGRVELRVQARESIHQGSP